MELINYCSTELASSEAKARKNFGFNRKVEFKLILIYLRSAGPWDCVKKPCKINNTFGSRTPSITKAQRLAQHVASYQPFFSLECFKSSIEFTTSRWAMIQFDAVLLTLSVFTYYWAMDHNTCEVLQHLINHSCDSENERNIPQTENQQRYRHQHHEPLNGPVTFLYINFISQCFLLSSQFQFQSQANQLSRQASCTQIFMMLAVLDLWL